VDTATERPARGPVSRGRHARERVLRAALEVLADQGMPGFTMEAVALRAGASKATVYRHWTSRAALLVDAMELVADPFAPPATGRLRTDLVELVSRLLALVGDQPFPRLMAAFVDAAERDPTLASLQVQITERRREPLRQVLARARDRGEIPVAADIELAVDLLAGPAFYRRFIAHQAFPRDYATAVVDHVLAALSSHPGHEVPSAAGEAVERGASR
jgi:AcrR family transcriptional regulator